MIVSMFPFCYIVTPFFVCVCVFRVCICVSTSSVCIHMNDVSAVWLSCDFVIQLHSPVNCCIFSLAASIVLLPAIESVSLLAL